MLHGCVLVTAGVGDVVVLEKFPDSAVVDAAEPVRNVTVSLVEELIVVLVILSAPIDVAPLSIDPRLVPNVIWEVSD